MVESATKEGIERIKQEYKEKDEELNKKYKEKYEDLDKKYEGKYERLNKEMREIRKANEMNNRFWKERIAYIAVIVGLVSAGVASVVI